MYSHPGQERLLIITYTNKYAPTFRQRANSADLALYDMICIIVGGSNAVREMLDSGKVLERIPG
jgi:hypothetical protein